MEKGFNQDLQCFIQSYEAKEVLDSAVLIAPLVFFIVGLSIAQLWLVS